MKKIKKLSQLLNMRWKDYPSKCLTHEEFLALFDKLDKKNLARTKTQYQDRAPGKWFIDSTTYANKKYNGYGSVQLYYWDPSEGPIVYHTNPVDNNRNINAQALNQNPGSLAYKTVVQKFAEVYQNEKLNLRKAFGTTDEDIKACVPKQFYWLDSSALNKKIEHLSCVDFCSQYASNILGTLPDSHGAKTIEGRVKPNKEFPFAFYLKTLTIAEWDEQNECLKYDTHNWLFSRFSQSLLTNLQKKLIIETSDCDETTILMKASKYNLNEVMTYFYDRRKTDEIAKLIMVAFIGFLHKKNYSVNKYAHLAAISIARSNEKMRALAEELPRPLHICVDGLIYQGSNELGTHDKALTLCHQEFTDCEGVINQMNVYVIMKNNEVIKYKHGAFNARDDKKDVEYCEGFEALKHLQRVDIITNIIRMVEALKNGEQ